ncbi:hypothetical protein LTR78_010137 [Recurvomyces mirabilis]|uniref:Uncharacterized protein n=1 Tax=Recurvomyces mirabilis TaxID=574656 RepID=A0AAE0TNA7_9PEZI|nr:hypothetical protein LTR78_010137 [Recurvomyces mirabilis]KAK5149928.1 hypothetical protein LTS14_010533 [Recurvomyces mirabilis]
MIKLEIVEQANRALVQSRPLVAVFVGAAQGTGEYALRELAKTHGVDGKGLNAYLVARNEERAEKILGQCRDVCPNGHFHYVKAGDLSLLRDVDAVCTRLETAFKEDRPGGNAPNIDILCLTHIISRFGPPTYLIKADVLGAVTDEGLETTMSLHYYSRMRFITNLLLYLTTSEHTAHIISICSAGAEILWGTFYPDDLSLSKDPKAHYTYVNCRAHTTRMMTMFFETLAQQHRGKLSLIHSYPGMVFGPTHWSSLQPIWFQILQRVLYAARYFIATSPEESGQRTVFYATSRYPARSGSGQASRDVAMSTDRVVGGGSYSCWSGNDDINVEKAYTDLKKDGFQARVWDHTNEVLETISNGQRFIE